MTYKQRQTRCHQLLTLRSGQPRKWTLICLRFRTRWLTPLLSLQTFGSLISPNWKTYTPTDILPSQVFQASANRQIVPWDEQCCPATCRKSNLFVLRSETWNDSKTSPAVARGARLQPYLCWDREPRNRCQTWTFTLFILWMWTSQLFFICPNAESPVKTDPSQGGGLSGPQHLSRVPFLKWIFSLFILFYVLVYILFCSWRTWRLRQHVQIGHWIQAFINDRGK